MAQTNEKGEILFHEKDPIQPGRKVLLRTVTHYHVGLLLDVNERRLLLADASWIPDTGPFSDALHNGNLAETEPFPGVVYVSLGSIVDGTEWKHDLPNVKKGRR